MYTAKVYKLLKHFYEISLLKSPDDESIMLL